MADIVYEGMFILDANLYARDPDGISGQIVAMIQESGGEILVSRFWEERRLAYPINGHRKGVYWLTYFRISSVQLLEIQRRCHLTETVLRFLFLKVDARIVDHAPELEVKNGFLPVSDRPGLGLQLTEDRVRPFLAARCKR